MFVIFITVNRSEVIDSPSLIRSVLASQSSGIQALLSPCHFYPETKMPAHLPVNHFLEGSHLLTDVCPSSLFSSVHSFTCSFTRFFVHQEKGTGSIF